MDDSMFKANCPIEIRQVLNGYAVVRPFDNSRDYRNIDDMMVFSTKLLLLDWLDSHFTGQHGALGNPSKG
jgi:hypothetical protein